MYKADKTTLEMANFPIEGNIVDHSWPFIIIRENGKPDHLAIALLAHVVYWYRPAFDPITKQLGKKYKSDLLQRSYAEIEDMLGLTKREAQEAFQRLEKLDLVHRVLRTIEISGQKISNILFIKFNLFKLIEMRNAFFKKSIPLYAEKDEGVRQEVQGDTPIVMTYTETTPEISPKNTTTTSAPMRDDVVLVFSDEEKEQLNNFTPEQIAEATRKTNQDCVQTKNSSRVKFFFKVITNLPEKKKKLTVYDELVSYFKKDGLYFKDITHWQIEIILKEDCISFERGPYKQDQIELNKYFSWERLKQMCLSFGFEFQRS